MDPFQDPPQPTSGYDSPTIMVTPGDSTPSGPTSQDHSAFGSRPDSIVNGIRPRERKRVGFTSSSPGTGSADDTLVANSADGSRTHSRQPSTSEPSSATVATDANLHENLTAALREAFQSQGQLPSHPRPALKKGGLRTPPHFDVPEAEEDDDVESRGLKERSGQDALERAARVAKSVGSYSAPGSRRNSVEFIDFESHPRPHRRRQDDIPLLNLPPIHPGDNDGIDESGFSALTRRPRKGSYAEAHKLVNSLTTRASVYDHDSGSGLQSGQVTPTEEQADMDAYVPKPSKYKTSIFGSLMKYQNSQTNTSHQAGLGGQSLLPLHNRPSSSGATTPQASPPDSGASTPVNKSGKHWYPGGTNHSGSSLAQLVGSSSTLAAPTDREFGDEVAERLKKLRPGMGKRSSSALSLSSAFSKLQKPKATDEFKITLHVADVLGRHRYLMKLCKALMQYGAPTHRLEEYMKMSARVLEIESQFLYLPGCMIISFDDSSYHTTEVKIVRVSQGVDLGKLRDTHEIYKDVVHDRMGVDEATKRLEEVMKRKQKFRPWLLVPVYGLASACVGPFAFQARLIDLPIAFLLGCILGFLQLIVAPSSDLYANVFEISAAIITSFLARAFGSINGGNTFCFSALAQSAIALILPGYTVLCASLELQSRSIISGSVRMVYAIIYSLFLGFGITIGTVIFGLMDKNATSQTQCSNTLPAYWGFFFVPAFTMCLIIINQGKWKQAPVMLFISFAGYIVNYFSSKVLSGNAQVASTLGAFVIGALANLHSRLGQHFDNWLMDVWEHRLRPSYKKVRDAIRRRRHGGRHTDEGFFQEPLRNPSTGSASATPLQSPTFPRSSRPRDDDEKSTFEPRTRKVGYGLAAAAMLPAIFVQVPSGLSVSGSLVSGITSANQITHNVTGTTTVSSATDLSSNVNSVAFTVGLSVIQVAIGITVGLFLSALFVYPFGKRRSGLFSF